MSSLQSDYNPDVWYAHLPLALLFDERRGSTVRAAEVHTLVAWPAGRGLRTVELLIPSLGGPTVLRLNDDPVPHSDPIANVTGPLMDLFLSAMQRPNVPWRLSDSEAMVGWSSLVKLHPHLPKLVLGHAVDDLEVADFYGSFPLEPWLKFAFERGVRMAAANKRRLDAIQLLVAVLAEHSPTSEADSATHLYRWLHAQKPRKASLKATGLALREVLDLPAQDMPDIGISGRGNSLAVDSRDLQFLRTIVRDAASISERASRTSAVDTRHVIAVLIEPVSPYLRSLGFDLATMRRSLFDFIVDSHPDDDRDVWRKILLVPLPFELQNRAVNDTWTRNDTLGYRLYAKAIAEPLRDGTAKPPLTIGIQAPWGQGKTSLMRMIQEQLDDQAPERDRQPALPSAAATAIRSSYAWVMNWMKQPAPPAAQGGMLDLSNGRIPTVWFNPLYYRETSQLWGGMAHAILHQLAAQLNPPRRREEFWLHLQLSRINAGALRRDMQRFLLARALPMGAAVIAGAALATLISPIYPAVGFPLGVAVSALTYAWKKTETIDKQFDRYVTEPSYQTELGLLHLIDHDLDRALQLLVADHPIAVFIDDLDRCDPQTVNQVILAINQFLSLPHRNVFFFLGMDMDMVAAALEKAQQEAVPSAPGPNAPRRSFGWRFMEKFVQLPFVIPHLDDAAAKQFATEHLRGSAAIPPSASVEEIVARAQLNPRDVDSIAREALAETRPPAERAALEEAFSNIATKLLQDPQGEEIQRIVDIAIEDLDLNPRTIKRYFSLVRVLRNIQIASGASKSPDLDRRMVLRAAHLLLNWPQFVQWLTARPNLLTVANDWKPSVGEIERLAATAATYSDWSEATKTLGPACLQDVTLYHYLRRLALESPKLSEIYAARVF